MAMISYQNLLPSFACPVHRSFVPPPKSTSALLDLPSPSQSCYNCSKLPQTQASQVPYNTTFLDWFAAIFQTTAEPAAFGSTFCRRWEAPSNWDIRSFISREKNRGPRNTHRGYPKALWAQNRRKKKKICSPNILGSTQHSFSDIYWSLLISGLNFFMHSKYSKCLLSVKLWASFLKSKRWPRNKITAIKNWLCVYRESGGRSGVGYRK